MCRAGKVHHSFWWSTALCPTFQPGNCGTPFGCGCSRSSGRAGTARCCLEGPVPDLRAPKGCKSACNLASQPRSIVRLDSPRTLSTCCRVSAGPLRRLWSSAALEEHALAPQQNLQRQWRWRARALLWLGRGSSAGGCLRTCRRRGQRRGARRSACTRCCRSGRTCQTGTSHCSARSSCPRDPRNDPPHTVRSRAPCCCHVHPTCPWSMHRRRRCAPIRQNRTARAGSRCTSQNLRASTYQPCTYRIRRCCCCGCY